MNCEQVRANISGFTDNSLSGIMSQAISKHITRCENCAALLAQEQLLVRQLSRSPIPMPRNGFYQDALKCAREYHQGRDLINMPIGFAPAVASFLLGVLLTILLQTGGFGIFPNTGVIASGVQLLVEENKQLDIHLQVSVNSDINNAMMTIEVPPSLQIVGFEGINVLEWPVVLKKGKNVLALPVKARRHFSEDQISYLVARLTTGEVERDFDIKVTIKSSRDSRQQVADLPLVTQHSTVVLSARDTLVLPRLLPFSV